MRIRLLSGLYWGYGVFVLIIFWFAVAIPWLLVLPFDRRRRFAHWYASLWGNHLNWACPFWTPIVEGREKIRDDRAHVLVANHQSSADIMVMFALRTQFRWVAKRELFFAPFLGWMMWMSGYVGIKRGSRHSSEKMMLDCRRQLDLGNSLLIFPEGTRTTTGELRPFKRGAFTLACEADVPVVPIVLEGTQGALPRDNWVFPVQRKLYVVIRVLDPIEPAEYGHDARALMKAVRARIQAEREVLRREIDARGGLTAPPPWPDQGVPVSDAG